jgi:hypothetical protein
MQLMGAPRFALSALPIGASIPSSFMSWRIAGSFINAKNASTRISWTIPFDSLSCAARPSLQEHNVTGLFARW